MTVLTHSTKKPGCGSEVLEFLRDAPNSGVTKASQIAVVGDRLFTDVMMANMMGSWSIWVKDGVIEKKSFVSMERPAHYAEFMTQALAENAPVYGIGKPAGELLISQTISTPGPVIS